MFVARMAAIAILCIASTVAAIGIEPIPVSTFASRDQTVRFASNFPGGRIDHYTQLERDRFELVIRPETEPINDSAWYAFRVESDRDQPVTLQLRYEGGSHRYRPKMSTDRKTWTSAEHLVVRRDPAGRQVDMQIPPDSGPVWIAGQELITNADAKSWVNSMSKHPRCRRETIGKSVHGRPLDVLRLGNRDAERTLFLMSRQHPPEVSGSIGMRHFAERLMADDAMTERFLDAFEVVILPVANPDGVALGHWRTNANGIDLNRDWRFFTQPETRAIRDELLRLDGRTGKSDPPRKLWLMIDFHSTWDEVFYTPPSDNSLFPLGFTHDWLTAIDDAMDDFDVTRNDAHNPHYATSKVWVMNNLNVHAITYEFGDETDRARIAKIARVSCDQMIRLLMKKVDAGK